MRPSVFRNTNFLTGKRRFPRQTSLLLAYDGCGHRALVPPRLTGKSLAFLMSSPSRYGTLPALLLAIAALAPAAGCRRGSAQVDLAIQDARDDEERQKLEAERAALRREAAAAKTALDEFAAPLARLREREAARAGGRWHVVYKPASGRLQLFHATRPLAACAVARGETPAPPPGRYPLLRMEILIPPEAGDPPNLPGRPKTAGGLSRLVFAGADGKPLFFVTSKGSRANRRRPRCRAGTSRSGISTGCRWC